MDRFSPGKSGISLIFGLTSKNCLSWGQNCNKFPGTFILFKFQGRMSNFMDTIINVDNFCFLLWILFYYIFETATYEYKTSGKD